MIDGLRKTGIDVLGDVPWGAHLCQLYQEKDDLMEVLVPYLMAGLENNEYCVWVTSEPLTHDEAREVARDAIPAFEEYAQRGQIEIVPHTDWYLKGGCFDPEAVVVSWTNKLGQALDRGYDGLRVTGNVCWVGEGTWSDFARYEEAVNASMGQARLIALCSYPLHRCGASRVVDVINNHRCALVKRDGGWVIAESYGFRATEDRLRLAYSREVHLRHQLEQEVRARVDFARALAHELKTPLTPVLAAGSALASVLEEGPLSDLARSVVRGASKLNNRIDDLLDVVKSETGALQLDYAKTDVLRLLRRIVAEMRPLALIQGKTLVADLPSALPPTWADEARLKQVLLNLLGNAFRFAPSNGTVVLRAGQMDSRVVIEVQDDGPGIPTEQQPSLFRSYRELTGDARPWGGLALGLALCKALVELHGGQVWVESQEGRGSTFGFSIPVRASPGGEGGAESRRKLWPSPGHQVTKEGHSRLTRTRTRLASKMP
ncbi:MAG: hypothetical protein DRI40_06485 [Chloroflexi bacterium]|nr:MAG: hypothetical protein DRI40_06485 [Chloroflexota bacterium]